MSRWLALLEYEGRRSGRRFAIPVLYAETGDGFVVVALLPERKRWWRTFRAPTRASLLVRGEWRRVAGHLLEGSERDDALVSYLDRFPRAARQIGDTAHAHRTDRAAVVAFTPQDT